MQNDIKSILISKEEIAQKTKELAEKINKDFAGKELIVIGILRGAILFFSDLVKQITLPIEIDFMSLSSYGTSTVSKGIVKIRKDIDSEITGKHILVVEDIVDSGLSLKYILKYLAKHEPASVNACVLLDKPNAHKDDIHIEYVGFEVGNEFVVGYGLDYAEKYRNLPYIGILKEEIYTNE